MALLTPDFPLVLIPSPTQTYHWVRTSTFVSNWRFGHLPGIHLLLAHTPLIHRQWGYTLLQPRHLSIARAPTIAGQGWSFGHCTSLASSDFFEGSDNVQQLHHQTFPLLHSPCPFCHLLTHSVGTGRSTCSLHVLRDLVEPFEHRHDTSGTGKLRIDCESLA